MINDALDFIIEEEGFREKPYLDTVGVSTFGHGLTYITEDESMEIVQRRLNNIEVQLGTTFDWFYLMNHIRQIVIISMVYQLGFTGFSKFKKMIAALEIEDYEEAAKEGLDSRWAKQTPSRAKRQMDMLRNG